MASLLANIGKNVFGAAADTFKNLGVINLDKEKAEADDLRKRNLARFTQELADTSTEKRDTRLFGQQKELSALQSSQRMDEAAYGAEVEGDIESGLIKQRGEQDIARLREEQSLIGERERKAFERANDPERTQQITEATYKAMENGKFQAGVEQLGLKLRQTYDPESGYTIQEWVEKGLANYFDQELKDPVSDKLKAQILTQANKSFDSLKVDAPDQYEVLVADAGGDEEMARTKYVGSQYAVSVSLMKKESILPKKKPTYEDIIGRIDAASDPEAAKQEAIKKLQKNYPDLAQQIEGYQVSTTPTVTQPTSSLLGGAISNIKETGKTIKKGLLNIHKPLLDLLGQ